MRNSQEQEKVQFQQKQCYLREHILDKGHDPEQFAEFINDQLEIQSDLNRCTMNELQNVVSKFIKKRYSTSQPYSLTRTEPKEEQEKVICQKIQKEGEIKKIFFKGHSEVSENQFYEKQGCIKVNLKYNDVSGISCQVSNPQRKSVGGIMGIGGTSFLVFQVRIYGLQKEPVERRYSDFVWLRNILRKFFPTYVIPPIPNKKAHKRTAYQIRKRMRILTLFLNDIVKMPILLNNKYVEGFLLFKDANKFEKLKEEGENKKSYESIKSTETLSGEVQIELSQKTLNYKDCLRNFVPEAQILYKEITRNSKKVKGLITQQINTLYSMGDQFSDLFEMSTKFNRVIKTDGFLKLSKIYVALNNMMIQWGNSLKSEVQQIEKNVSTFFKYVRQQFMGFNEILNQEIVLQNEFIREKQNLDRIKEKIFLQHDIKKWGLPKQQIQFVPKSSLNDRTQANKIMLPKESVAVQKMKKKLAHSLSQIYINGNDYFIRTAEKFCENFKEFSIKTKVSNQQVGAMWMQMSEKFSDPYQLKANIQKMGNFDEKDINEQKNEIYD